MTRLLARPLEAAPFTRFGSVAGRPACRDGGATVVGAVGPAENLRPGVAAARLGWFAAPASAWPVTARAMERHRFSSQSFVPCGDAAWLVLVAPHRPDHDGPDMAQACAFVASGEQAVTLRPDTWHHPLTAFAPATFAVLAFLAGDADDEEFHSLAAPVVVLRA